MHRTKVARLFTYTLALLCALPTAAACQDRRDWQSVAQLQTGDRFRLSLETGSVTVMFRNWTPQQVTVAAVTARREDVRKIWRYREGGWQRAKCRPRLLLGLGGGSAIGAAGGGCHPDQFCIVGRGIVAAALGGAGMLIGAGIGALIPAHRKDLIYSAK